MTVSCPTPSQFKTLSDHQLTWNAFPGNAHFLFLSIVTQQDLRVHELCLTFKILRVQLAQATINQLCCVSWKWLTPWSHSLKNPRDVNQCTTSGGGGLGWSCFHTLGSVLTIPWHVNWHDVSPMSENTCYSVDSLPWQQCMFQMLRSRVIDWKYFRHIKSNNTISTTIG